LGAHSTLVEHTVTSSWHTDHQDAGAAAEALEDEEEVEEEVGEGSVTVGAVVAVEAGEVVVLRPVGVVPPGVADVEVPVGVELAVAVVEDEEVALQESFSSPIATPASLSPRARNNS